MEPDQQERFKEAVERKKEESDARSRATQQDPPPEAGGVQGDQASLRDTAQTQDAFSPREKSTGHKKHTADKWNQ